MANLTPAKIEDLENIFLDYLGSSIFTRQINSPKSSIVDELPPKRRTGIYELKYSNGHYYVGKSNNVANRYRTHYKNCSEANPKREIIKVYFQANCAKESIRTRRLCFSQVNE